MIVEEDKRGKSTTKLVDNVSPRESKCFRFFHPLRHITAVSLLSQNSHPAHRHANISLEPRLPTAFSISVCRGSSSSSPPQNPRSLIPFQHTLILVLPHSLL